MNTEDAFNLTYSTLESTVVQRDSWPTGAGLSEQARRAAA